MWLLQRATNTSLMAFGEMQHQISISPSVWFDYINIIATIETLYYEEQQNQTHLPRIENEAMALDVYAFLAKWLAVCS